MATLNCLPIRVWGTYEVTNLTWEPQSICLSYCLATWPLLTGLDAFRPDAYASLALVRPLLEALHEIEELRRDTLLQNLPVDADEVLSDGKSGVLPHRAPATIAATRVMELVSAISPQ